MVLSEGCICDSHLSDLWKDQAIRNKESVIMNEPIDEDRIRRRVKAREVAGDVACMAVDMAKEEDSVFWEELGRLLLDSYIKLPEKKIEELVPFKPMTIQQAKVFGNQLMPYGEFQGRRIDEVPLDRLQWYADQFFVDDLRRYLESRQIQKEVEE